MTQEMSRANCTLTPCPSPGGRGDLARADAIIRARAELRPAGNWFPRPPEAEGGCGVTGFACNIPLGGKHIYEPSIQMRNRGNGKGGGIAACGLVPEDMGVSPRVLRDDYILQIALLDPKARGEVEQEAIEPFFDVDQGGMVATVDDYRSVPLLEVRPPDVARYFVRVKPDVLAHFAEEKGLAAAGLSERDVEDEFVYQNSIRLNNRFYASLGDKRAFVVSHARNLIIMKIVGYAEAAVEYYRMPDMRAHVWIAHQRYPTKGRVWHPGGAHPFIGLNEALVHNGDFANYASVSEYLAGRNIFPQFLTDTEVSVLLFDLWSRVYRYPVEYIIEALAPTTELDFDRLPPEKQRIYRQIQAAHIHASPDGPWFFIIARSLAETGEFQLLGITDTAMLRPQVFALSEGEVSIGLICSEKQAIDATLASLAADDPRFTPVADTYWNARGGSHTDGGTFLLTVSPNGRGKGNGEPKAPGLHPGRVDKHEKAPGLHPGDTGPAKPQAAAAPYSLRVTNKFGVPVSTPPGQVHCNLSLPAAAPGNTAEDQAAIRRCVEAGDAAGLFAYFREGLAQMSFDRLRWLVDEVARQTAASQPALGIEVLTLAIDRRYPTWDKKRSSIVTILRGGLEQIFQRQPRLDEDNNVSGTLRVPPGHPLAGDGTRSVPDTYIRRVDWASREQLRGPRGDETTLLIDARGFPPEGLQCDATLAVRAYKLGWRRLVHYNSRGTRFHGAGFGPRTAGLRIDCYDNPGDYLGSGIDGLEIYVHGNAQDQVCQIAKCGKLVVYGDVGQTFLYGAKGGEIYVLGNAAGRPMINAVGAPRVVINGTALDFLAESFMAGNPHEGGGFAVLNGLTYDQQGKLVPLDRPYPGSNLLSLASGGAIYVRDPRRTLVEEQLNGGAYRPLSTADWKLILPYLEENQRLFDVRIERDLLTVDGRRRQPAEVYRKVMPRKDAELAAELEGMGE
jgi:glutamate synthase domain-containing protein 1/glutamate synthase domain-containing protein 3